MQPSSYVPLISNLNEALTLQQRDEAVLIVWADNLDHIIPLCNDFDEKLVRFVWHARPHSRSASEASIALGSGVARPAHQDRALSFISPGGCVGNFNKVWPGDGTGWPERTPSTPSTPLTPATLVGGTFDQCALSDSEKIKSAYLSPPDAEVKSCIYALGHDPERGEYQRAVPLSKEQVKLTKIQQEKDKKNGKKELKLVESGKAPARKMRLFAPVYGGSAAGLSIFFVAKGIREYLDE